MIFSIGRTTYLIVVRFAMISYDRALVTVQSDARVMKCFLRLAQIDLHVGHTTLKDTSEVPWYQRSSNSFGWLKGIIISKTSNQEKDRLTISLGSVFKTNRQREGSIILEELICKRIPPKIVRVIASLLQALVHLEYSKLRLPNFREERRMTSRIHRKGTILGKQLANKITLR